MKRSQFPSNKAAMVSHFDCSHKLFLRYPGYIITPLFKNLAAKTPLGVEKSIEKEGASIPLGRMGTPEDIANGILFLASDESSYVTGLELIIDGGKVIV
jgi:NAD(P)-dependent dehydrogenase (short-subunit alcohol dehydrogenase family)